MGNNSMGKYSSPKAPDTSCFLQRPLHTPEKISREELVLLKSSFFPHPKPQQITISWICEMQQTS